MSRHSDVSWVHLGFRHCEMFPVCSAGVSTKFSQDHYEFNPSSSSSKRKPELSLFFVCLCCLLTSSSSSLNQKRNSRNSSSGRRTSPKQTAKVSRERAASCWTHTVNQPRFKLAASQLTLCLGTLRGWGCCGFVLTVSIVFVSFSEEAEVK